MQAGGHIYEGDHRSGDPATLAAAAASTSIIVHDLDRCMLLPTAGAWRRIYRSAVPPHTTWLLCCALLDRSSMQPPELGSS